MGDGKEGREREGGAAGDSLGPRLAFDLKANFCLGAIAFRACESLFESSLIR